MDFEVWVKCKQQDEALPHRPSTAKYTCDIVSWLLIAAQELAAPTAFLRGEFGRHLKIARPYMQLIECTILENKARSASNIGAAGVCQT